MEIKIQTSNDKHRELLQIYEGIIYKMFLVSQRKFKVKLPDVIVLRPMKQCKFKNWESVGRAGYTVGKELWIALKLKYYTGHVTEFLTDNMAEEVAHIIDYLITGKIDHQEPFGTIKSYILEKEEW